MAEDKDKGKGPPTPPAPPAWSTLGEVEIEFGDSRNRVMAWPPTMENLRGHWLRVNLNSDEMVEQLSSMPDIPGQRLKLDAVRARSLIYDPLALPENAEICAKIQRIIKAAFLVDQGPAKPLERKDFDDDDLKTWFYWAARKVDAKQAKVTSGKLPTAEAIMKMAGRIRIENYNSSARACKWMEDFNRYLDAILSMGRGPVPIA